MILHTDYLKAKKVVEEYENQLANSVVRVNDLNINQKIKRNYPESWDYWVSEINGEDVLIRTTEDKDDEMYDDFWVNISELRLN